MREGGNARGHGLLFFVLTPADRCNHLWYSLLRAT